MLISIFLPLSLVVIMFSLGISLKFADFTRVAAMPKPFFVGVAAQFVLLPAVAFVLLLLFPLAPELAVGVMILSFCPGGMTSNIITKFAGGTLALSISMTAVISLMSMVTLPVLTALAVTYFLGASIPHFSAVSLGLSMFALTAIPVAIGVVLRRYQPDAAKWLEIPVHRFATLLFVTIVVGALVANWELFVENVAILGPILVAMSAILFTAGFGLAKVMNLPGGDQIAIAVEVGIQNSTVGITVGSLIAGQAGSLSAFSLPAGVYGIIMYAISVPMVLMLRKIR